MLFLFKFFPLFSSSLVRSAVLSILSQYTSTQNRKRCQTGIAKSFPLFPFSGVFGTPVLWLSSDLLFCLLSFPLFLLPVFPFSFFAKNQMCLTLKIVAQ